MNPNNCSTCEHSQVQSPGHCYMFRDEPQEVCAQHTGKSSWDWLPGVKDLMPGPDLTLRVVNTGLNIWTEAAKAANVAATTTLDVSGAALSTAAEASGAALDTVLSAGGAVIEGLGDIAGSIDL